ncbi:MAG: hypothetical protein ACHQAY_25785 [Hyphomicrobiales bacterium]
MAEKPLQALARLADEAARGIERLTAGGDPIDHFVRLPAAERGALRKLNAARRRAAAMVERLIAFLEAIEGDPDLEDDGTAETDDDDDGEPSLAVPECVDWRSQAATWASACNITIRDQELERDIDTEEADDLDEKECSEEDRGEDSGIEYPERDDFPYDPPKGPRMTEAVGQ